MWIVMTSSARSKSGPKRNVALVQLTQHTPRPARCPSLISERTKGVLRVVHMGACNVGKTPRAQYQRTLAEAERRVAKLNNAKTVEQGDAAHELGRLGTTKHSRKRPKAGSDMTVEEIHEALLAIGCAPGRIRSRQNSILRTPKRGCRGVERMRSLLRANPVAAVARIEPSYEIQEAALGVTRDLVQGRSP
jgi:hypothetical protein